jgi:hypothetical protein
MRPQSRVQHLCSCEEVIGRPERVRYTALSVGVTGEPILPVIALRK